MKAQVKSLHAFLVYKQHSNRLSRNSNGKLEIQA